MKDFRSFVVESEMSTFDQMMKIATDHGFVTTTSTKNRQNEIDSAMMEHPSGVRVKIERASGASRNNYFVSKSVNGKPTRLSQGYMPNNLKSDLKTFVDQQIAELLSRKNKLKAMLDQTPKGSGEAFTLLQKFAAAKAAYDKAV